MGNSNGAASALCCGDTRGSAGKHLLRQAKTPDDRLKSTLRKQVVSQRRSSARKYQQSVLNPQLRYDPSEDAETDEETLPEVVKEDDHEITIELITAMLSGCKVRFDKACKYHPGNEEGDHEKFHTWLRRTKTAFRRTAYLCRIEIEKLGPLDPARLQFVQKQSDSYRYLAVLFNELTPRVKSAAANLAKAAVLMRSVNQLVEEEKLVKQGALFGGSKVGGKSGRGTGGHVVGFVNLDLVVVSFDTCQHSSANAGSGPPVRGACTSMVCTRPPCSAFYLDLLSRCLSRLCSSTVLLLSSSLHPLFILHSSPIRPSFVLHSSSSLFFSHLPSSFSHPPSSSLTLPHLLPFPPTLNTPTTPPTKPTPHTPPPTPHTYTNLHPTNTHFFAALGLCVEPRLRDWPAALGHAQRLAELRKTPQRQADVQLFEHLVESGSKTAVVSYSKATGSYQVGIVGEDGGGGGAAGGPSFQLRPPSTGSNKSGKGKTGPQKIDGPQKLPPLSAG